MHERNDYSRFDQMDRALHLHPKTNPVLYKKDGGPMIVAGQGVYVWDSRGTRLLDGVAGLANVNAGYGERRIIDAIADQLSSLSYFHTFTGFSNPTISRLSGVMAERFHGLTKFYYVSSGSEAIDTSVKFAHYYWRLMGKPAKTGIVGFNKGYHGNTILASALTGMPEYHEQFELPRKGISFIDPPYQFREAPEIGEAEFAEIAAQRLEAELQARGAENIAAFIAEPVLASGGCIVPPASYWSKVREICDAHDILLIFDEVITGFGRLGHWLGGEAFDTQPDICAMAKGISSAYIPMGAVGLSERVGGVLSASDEYLMHGFSASGHPVSAAATLANIQVIEDDDLLANARSGAGQILREGLEELRSHDLVVDARGVGMAMCLELDAARLGAKDPDFVEHPAAVFSHLCRQLGLIVRGNESVVLISPPISMTAREADHMLSMLQMGLKAMRGALK